MRSEAYPIREESFLYISIKIHKQFIVTEVMACRQYVYLTCSCHLKTQVQKKHMCKKAQEQVQAQVQAKAQVQKSTSASKSTCAKRHNCKKAQVQKTLPLLVSSTSLLLKAWKGNIALQS